MVAVRWLGRPLDLGAREELLQLLSGYAGAPQAPGIIMVTHHVEEIVPEIDRVGFFPLDEARVKLKETQWPLVERLWELLSKQ